MTIAHRLKTIIEYDRILVLDKGKLAEQGTPLDLINQKGIFAEMIAQSGKEFENEMIELATRKQENNPFKG